MSTVSKIKTMNGLQNDSKNLWKSLISLSTVFVFVNYFYSVFSSPEQITLKSTFLEIVLISFGVLSQALLFSYKLFPNPDYLKTLSDAEYSTMIFGGLFRKFSKPKTALSRLGGFFVVSLILVGVIYWIFLEGGKTGGISYFSFILSGLLSVCATPNLFFLPVVFSQILVFKSLFFPVTQFNILDAIMILFFIIQYGSLFYCLYGSKMNIFRIKLKSITASKFLAAECMKVVLIGSAVYAVSPGKPIEFKLDKFDKKDKKQSKKKTSKNNTEQDVRLSQENQRDLKNLGVQKTRSQQSDQSIQGVGNENREVLDGSTGLKDTRTRDNNPNPGTSKTRDLSDLMRDLDTIPKLLKKRKSSTNSRHIQDHLNSTANKAKRLGEKYGDHELSNISQELRSLARSFDAGSLSNPDGKNIPPGKGGGRKSPQGAGKEGTKGLPPGALADMDPKQMKRALSQLSKVKRDLSKLKINAESQRVGSENGKGGGSGKRLVNVNRLESKNARSNIEGGSKSGSPRLSSVEDVMKKSPKSLTLDRDSQVKSKMKEKIKKKKSHDKRKEDHKKKLFKILKIILVCAGTAAIVYVLYFMFFKKRKKKAIEKGSKKLSRKKLRDLERELAAMLDLPYENPLKARLAIIKIYHQVLRMFAEKGEAKAFSTTPDEFYIEKVRENAGVSYSNLSYVTNVFNHVAYSTFLPSDEIFNNYVNCAKSLLK